MAKMLRSFPIDVYGAWLHVASTRKQWKALRFVFDELDESPGAVGLTHMVFDPFNTPHIAVWVSAEATTDRGDLIDTIAHESVHAAAQLLDHIGQASDRHDSEALAYLTGFVASKVWSVVA